jgi:DNA-binding NarL/FixJ family response regulator
LASTDTTSDLRIRSEVPALVDTGLIDHELRIAVVVVDTQTLFRSGLARLLSEDDSLFVAGVSDGGPELPQLCATMSIDTVLTDIQVRGWDAIELIRSISTFSPATRVLIVAAEADWRVVPAMAAGAAGFVLKDAAPAAIRSAVVAVHHGERVLCKEAAQWLIQDSPDHRLTSRERDILRLVAQGADNRQIAQVLQLGDKTVRNYVSRVYRKLAVNNRAQISPIAVYADSRAAPDSKSMRPATSGLPQDSEHA